MFRNFMDYPDDLAKIKISGLIDRLSSSPISSKSGEDSYINDMILRLHNDFPGDRLILT